jgi:mannosyltransferase
LMTFQLITIPMFGFGVAALALFGAWQLRHERTTLILLGSAFMAMPIAIALLSIHQPVLVPRYLIWSTGSYFVLAGIGVATLPIWSFPPRAAAVTIGAALSLAPYYTAQTKPRWDQAAVYLVGHVGPTDIVVARSKLAEFVLQAFAQRYNRNVAIPVAALSAKELLGAPIEVGQMWIVYGRVGQNDIESENEFREKWAALGKPVQEIRFGSHIVIFRYELDFGAASRQAGGPELGTERIPSKPPSLARF